MLEHRKVVAGAAQAEWESEKGELRFTKNKSNPEASDSDSDD